MDNTVVILGAGASQSCGGPLMAGFLDSAERLMKSRTLDTVVQKHFDDVFEGIYRLTQVHTKASLDTDNIEDVFAAFEMAELLELDLFPENLPAAMRTVISRTIEATIEFPVGRSESTVEVIPPRDYLNLAAWAERLVETRRRPAIITFNYDCVLDYALHRRSVGLDYGLGSPDDDPNGVPLLKLHGSLNWVRDGDKITPYHMARFDPLIGGEVDDRLRRSSAVSVQLPISQMMMREHFKGEQRGGQLAVVPPVWSKLEHYKAMRAVWARAAAVLRDAEQIVVCGYSLPGTDEFFRHLYALGTAGRSRIKSFLVFDIAEKDGPVEHRFRSLLGAQALGRFRYLPLSFSHVASQMEKELEG